MTSPTTAYYSGQGVVSVGAYTPAGASPATWTPVGNVSDLKIMIASSTVDHHESTSGNRSIDLRLFTEIKVSLSMTMESFSAANLAMALRGTETVVTATPTNTIIQPLVSIPTAVALQFIGLNTANGNAPVTVQVFKFQSDPLKELDLISDKVQQFVLEGMILYDNTIVTAGASPYFTVTTLT